MRVLGLFLTLSGVAVLFPFGYGAAQESIPLPPSRSAGPVSVEEAIHRRRSIRQFTDAGLDLKEVGQLLWAAQGITSPATGFRAAPSAGATYPLEVYLIAGKVKDLDPGVYRYLSAEHRLVRVREGDLRRPLSEAALGQSPIREAPTTFLIVAVYQRTVRRYGGRAERYVHMEAGHAAQNVALQAVALGLGSVVIGAFQDNEVKRAVGLGREEEPLYLIPVGR